MITIKDSLSRRVIRKFRNQKDRILYPTDKVNSFWARKRFYSGLLNPGDLVFDVGANHGNRVEVFLGLGCRVVAFEPQTHCISDLMKKFARNPDFRCVPTALGSNIGELSLMCSPVDTLSTLSGIQIERAKQSGRFNSCQDWDDFHTTIVTVSTLEIEIEKFGIPSFIKIDVEGFEPEVLQGLTEAIACISFEFTADSLDKACECLERLRQLGKWQLNFCHGESMKFSLPTWLNAEEFEEKLKILCARYPYLGGDIYAKLL